MPKILAISYFQNSKHNFQDVENVKVALKSCVENKYYKWTIESIYNKRSSSQNKAIWGFFYDQVQIILTDLWGEYIPISDSSDESVTVHNILKQHCLPVEYVEWLRKEYEQKTYCNPDGEIIYESKFRLTTTKMTTAQCNEYYENIFRWVGENLGVELKQL